LTKEGIRPGSTFPCEQRSAGDGEPAQDQKCAADRGGEGKQALACKRAHADVTGKEEGAEDEAERRQPPEGALYAARIGRDLDGDDRRCMQQLEIGGRLRRGSRCEMSRGGGQRDARRSHQSSTAEQDAADRHAAVPIFAR
jgi:hypothetical protein